MNTNTKYKTFTTYSVIKIVTISLCLLISIVKCKFAIRIFQNQGCNYMFKQVLCHKVKSLQFIILIESCKHIIKSYLILK